MNDDTFDNESGKFDFLEVPTISPGEAGSFSMHNKQQELLGGMGKSTILEGNTENAAPTLPLGKPEQKSIIQTAKDSKNQHNALLEHVGLDETGEKPVKPTGKELPANWPQIASPEEEARGYDALYDPGEDKNNPPTHHHIDRLSYTLKNGTKELRYLAVQHIFGTENKTHPQFAALKENFDRYKPQVVLYEGQKIHENSQIAEERAYKHGEKAYMQYLVQEHNKNLKAGEEPIALEPVDIPNEDEPAEYRKRGYSNEEIAANEVLKSIHYDASNVQDIPGLTSEQKAQKIHELQTKYQENPVATIRLDFFSWVPRADGQPWTVELIKQEIEKQTGQAIKVDIDHLSFPRFRQMFDDQREFRDQHVVRKIAEVSQKYDRVMVVMGSGHAIRDREALEQYFDINNKVLGSRIDDTDLKDTISQSIQSEAEKSTPHDGISEQNPPPPGSDPDVIKKYNEAKMQAQLQYEREQAERDRQGIEAARQSIKNIPGATMEVVKEYHAPAGKEVIKVNTYTPKSEPSIEKTLS